MNSVVTEKGQTTKWRFDEFVRVTNKVDQVGTEILRYQYDLDSRLTNRWSATKGNTKYKYDCASNLTNIVYALSTAVTFKFDANNRLTNMVDAAGTTVYAYTVGNQLFTEDGPFASDTVTATDVNRLRTALALQQPTSFWTNGLSYDESKRLTNVTSQAGSFGYAYDAQRLLRVKKLSLPNTAYITNTYDTVARVTGTYLKNSGNTTLDSYVYAYDPANERTNLTRADASTVDFTYDKISQLTIANSSVNTEDRGYFYDAAWNLNRRTNNGVTSTFIVDTRNQLTNCFSATNSYDLNGNLTTSTNAHNLYFYDDENRLAQWFSFLISSNSLSGGDLRTDFTYDGLGRLRIRIEYRWTPGGQSPPGGQLGALLSGSAWQPISEVHYIYDGKRVIQERDSSNAPLVSYTRGYDLSGTLEGAGGIGGLLARSVVSTHSTYFADGNGNITYLLNSSQAMVASYRYDPFGNTISSSGSLAAANVYRFSSKEIHVNSGMYYYLYRFYAPNLQRWINRDPDEENGGINLYGFNFNDPINRIDTMGEDRSPVRRRFRYNFS